MKPGPLTPMPSVALELGRYVTLRRRKDGTYRVLMEVPVRLRPSGWSAAIPLPINGARTGDLSDLGEVARIRDDAQALYVRLQQARIGGPAPEATGRDFPRLIREWQTSQGFKAKKPRTQQGYAYHASLIFDWSAANGHRPVAGLPRDAIEAFLALYDDRPTTRRHVKIVLKMLLDHAIALGWRTDNPAERIKMAAPESQLTIWEWEDARREAWACAMAGQPSIAAMILTNWEIGQRVTDLRLFRRGGEYDARQGLFRFWQSKTRSYVAVPVSDDLRGLLNTVAPADSLYLFTDAATGKPWAEQRLGHVFAAIRTRSELQLRALRHSCVVQQARAGCTVPEIAAVTGHSPFSVEQILRKYLPRDNQVAWNAQRKRGLIGANREQESDGHPTLESDAQPAATAK
ncbi:hypothetical protein [Phenylobacterium sp.]|uniref:tyrosine-type recombinase/integrase n=1 Tax=Phenylobacterium sp. TaxID=1871053 RepID=UPI0027304334|nr:hypothetical protein [Phenylobacterium sp.]MDP1875676.1 hypothetical protein [Phenylobacterium sp.]